MTRTIAFLIYDRFQHLDLAGPLAAFEVASFAAKPPPYQLQIIAPTAGPVRSSSGAATLADAMDDAGPIDTLIVAGGLGTLEILEHQALQAFLRRQASDARRVCSVCSGAFVLAAAGLLDDRTATTHWRYAQDMAARFPKVRVAMENIYVRDGALWTSAGVTAGIDLALALIADDLGDGVARAVAQELVVYHRRPGGQSQFSALLEVDRPDSRFAPIVRWIRENLDADLTVAQLADRAAMSARNFSRAFLSEIGLTPAKAVERIRLETARARVEASTQRFDTIASACGFGDADRMRRAFLRAFGQPPQAVRRNASFGGAPPHRNV